MSTITPTPAEWRKALGDTENAMAAAVRSGDTATQDRLHNTRRNLKTWQPGGTQ